jgi:hypothetical protein
VVFEKYQNGEEFKNDMNSQKFSESWTSDHDRFLL